VGVFFLSSATVNVFVNRFAAPLASLPTFLSIRILLLGYAEVQKTTFVPGGTSLAGSSQLSGENTSEPR
jgi:hypothetical protein